MQRSAEFWRGAKWWADQHTTGYKQLSALLAEAEAREGREAQAIQHRINQLEAMNAGLLRQLSNIRIACKPANLTAPDGKEWTFHPPDELVRQYWETLSKAVQDALASEAREAAEPDLGTVAPKRTGTIQVALTNGGAGKPLEYTDEAPSAAEVIAACEGALLPIAKNADEAQRLLNEGWVEKHQHIANKLQFGDVVEAKNTLATIAKWKEAQRG